LPFFVIDFLGGNKRDFLKKKKHPLDFKEAVVAKLTRGPVPKKWDGQLLARPVLGV